MKKQVLLGIGAVVVAAVLFFGYRIMTTGKLSPCDTVAFSQGGIDAKVGYCRPSKRGRLIFGEKDAGAVVPFGKYWRLGANAATEITFAKNVLFAGKPVSAGSYRMYAMPSATSWKLILNSEVGKWGAFEANHDKDVLTVEVPVEAAAAPVEQFTISFAGEPNGAKLVFAWDTTLVRVPLAAAN